MIDKSLMDACAYLFIYFTKMKYSYKSDAKMTKGNWKCFKKILPNLFRTKSLVWKKNYLQECLGIYICAKYFLVLKEFTQVCSLKNKYKYKESDMDMY